ncbi:hypothetical protein D3C77_452810 [compost metagenome]
MIGFGQADIKQARGPVHHAFQHESADIHLRQFFTDERERTDRTAELRAFIGIFCGVLDRILRSTNTPGS